MGQQLIEIKKSNAIVTPVLLVFLCGVGDKRELILTRAFLKPFKAIDDRRTLKRDWQEAQRLAERVARQPKAPRSRRLSDKGDRSASES